MKKKPFTEKELKRLSTHIQGLAYAKNQMGQENKFALRDLCILRLGIDSCLRVVDLLNITKDQLIASNGEVRTRIQLVEKKTGKNQEVSLSPKTVETLCEYLSSRTDNNPYLFVSRQSKDNPISTITWRQALKRHCESCGLDSSNFSTHSLRKTIPTILVRQGVSVRVCQNLLNHSSLNSTIHYLGIEQEESIEIKERYAPVF